MSDHSTIDRAQRTADPDPHLARPLTVLVPLIKDDLRRGDEAAHAAGLPYYRAAGEKLLEAKAQLPHGEFGPWIKRHFTITARHARTYMQVAGVEAARQNGNALPFSSLTAFMREHRNPNYNRPSARRAPVPPLGPRVETAPPTPADVAHWFAAWMNGITEQTATVSRWLADTATLTAEDVAAERALELQVIDLGYKALARTLHPDHGGSKEAMSRLNRVRDRMRRGVRP